VGSTPSERSEAGVARMSASADFSSRRLSAGAAGTRALTPPEIAWIAVIPCAVVTLTAIVVLGPALGHALFGSPGSDALWPPSWWQAQGHPEPVKQARYVLALLGPVLLLVVIGASVRRAPRLRPRTIRALTFASQAAVLAVLVLAALNQRDIVLAGRRPAPIFGAGSFLAAAALVLAAVLALRRRGVAERIARAARETSARRIAGGAIAGIGAAMCVLEGVSTDRLGEDVGAFAWTLNDAFAVLGGRTPLVDYHVIYAKLLPYPAALAMAALGATALVYTLAMAALSLLALLAVYAVLRRIVDSSLLALALFVPFVAMSDIEHPMQYTAMWPMRYGGAYLLAWLTARHVEARRPRHACLLFLVGGLVAIDNQEFGVGALLASAAALLVARPPGSVRSVLRLAAAVVGGACGAVAIVSLLTLIRTGALPDPALLLEWPRIFSTLGWFSLPMPAVGPHLALYATFVAAIVVAAVRSLRSREEVLLRTMLMWSGVFGLLASSYYVGRSEELKLAAMLSAWSLALVLLTIVCVRALAAQRWRRATLGQLLVLLGFGLSICSISRVPSPEAQIARLTKALPAPEYRPSAERFVRARTRRGEKVAILIPMSYRIAYELGLRNISPYGLQNEVVTRWQLQTVLDTVRRERVHAIFLPAELIAPQQLLVLMRAGFSRQLREGEFIELTGA
jgi:hypothetical protein